MDYIQYGAVHAPRMLCIVIHAASRETPRLKFSTKDEADMRLAMHKWMETANLRSGPMDSCMAGCFRIEKRLRQPVHQRSIFPRLAWRMRHPPQFGSFDRPARTLTRSG